MFRRKPSPSMVVAMVALFVALGGTSYAALTITSKQVKNNSLTGADIKTNSIASSDVKNGSLLAKDFKAGQFSAASSSPGPAGPVGPAGPKGDKGDTGTVDTSNFYDKSSSDGRYLRGTITVVARTTAIGDNSFGGAQANCPAGHQAVGGGVDPDNVFLDRVTNSQPIIEDSSRLHLLSLGQHAAPTGWSGWIWNQGAGGSVYVAAICAPIG